MLFSYKPIKTATKPPIQRSHTNRYYVIMCDCSSPKCNENMNFSFHIHINLGASGCPKDSMLMKSYVTK
jgi:hypothetical protein